MTSPPPHVRVADTMELRQSEPVVIDCRSTKSSVERLALRAPGEDGVLIEQRPSLVEPVTTAEVTNSGDLVVTSEHGTAALRISGKGTAATAIEPGGSVAPSSNLSPLSLHPAVGEPLGRTQNPRIKAPPDRQ
jgi:hypothetical protein